jgi:hypothetical protein
MSRVLSVDWDFFFPVPNADEKLWGLYDWSHGESPFFRDLSWPSRAVGFTLNGLPLPGPSGDEKTFWSRFNLSEVAGNELHYADSHAEIVNVLQRGDSVVNYDAHHDGGYGKQLQDYSVSCEDWAHYHVEYQRGAVKLVYPAWKKTMECFPEKEPDCQGIEVTYDQGAADPEPFEYVFVCRSGSWVPSWLDDQFKQFLDASGLDLVPIGACEHRGWGHGQAQKMLESHENAWKLLRELQAQKVL